MPASRKTSALASKTAPMLRSSRRSTTTNRRTSDRVMARREASDRSLAVNISDVDSSPITANNVMEDSVEEVVDLTCEADSSVVDLTHNESVMVTQTHTQEPDFKLPPHTIPRRRPKPCRGPQTERAPGQSYIICSDDEDASLPPPLPPPPPPIANRSTPGNISCPICLDSYSEMMQSGRLVVATKCGHVFCSQCLRDALKSSVTCPTCRAKLTRNQYHPLYI